MPPKLARAVGKHATPIADLDDLLGEKLARTIVRPPDRATFLQWRAGPDAPSSTVMKRVEAALKAARMLAREGGREQAQDWFGSRHSQFGGVSPAAFLSHATPHHETQQVVDVADRYSSGRTVDDWRRSYRDPGRARNERGGRRPPIRPGTRRVRIDEPPKPRRPRHD
jgi:hypothetical protein